MGWEYSDTNCIFANVCSFSPRCIAKSRNECNKYVEDKRTFLQKLFHLKEPNNEMLLEIFNESEVK